MKIKEKLKRGVVIAVAMLNILAMNTMTAFATGADENNSAPDVSAVTYPLEVIKIIAVTIVSTIGYVGVVMSLVSLKQAMDSHDNSQLGTALKGLAGSAICAAVGTVLAIMRVD